MRLLELSRVAVVLANALRRVRSLAMHHGLQYVMVAVMAIVFACSGLVRSDRTPLTGPPVT